ncbi:MAG: methionine--tRNA ligase [Rhodospirillaceae bacterium]|nr:methionine--tRNA ligase [Rhodospirillaceae bacterium]
MSQERFYITTAIAYPNGAPHIGHGYELIATDAIARFMRLDGRDVLFLTGSDEHGQKMQQTAEREGISPRQLAERNTARFREMGPALNASNDDYIRTSEERHYKTCAALWEKMVATGDIYLDKYAGWYSVRDEAYYDASELTKGADGNYTAPSGTPVEWVEEESYFFRLSRYQDKLLELYERVPNFISPETRRNEVMSFVKGGLKDLSVSRTTFDWGIPVPGDPKHIMYVWVDALTNYVTATGWPDETHPRAKFWPADVHIIGKDIVRFHTVYWPAFLMSAGLPLPKRVFCHGFLFNKGEKMSKSVGNVIDPFALASHYGIDPVRYFFLREVPFGQDGSYSPEAIVQRMNADLANDLGNLAQRSLSMIAKNLGGELPQPGPLGDEDKAMLAEADGLIAMAREAMSDFALHQMLSRIWAVIAEANRYFAGNEPWALRKSNPERFGTVLWVTAEVLRQVAILTQPVMPTACGKLLDILGVPVDKRSFAELGGGARIVGGSTLPAPVAIFPRYVEAETE